MGRRKKETERGSYVHLRSAVDRYSSLASTEALQDERTAIAIGFLHRARAWFAAHGITKIERFVTDNGSRYRAGVFARALLGAPNQRITRTRHGITARSRGRTASLLKGSSTP